MYLTVMLPNSLFIKADIMAGVHIIVYIEAKMNSDNNVSCAAKSVKLYIMARFNSNLKVYIYVITSIYKFS